MKRGAYALGICLVKTLPLISLTFDPIFFYYFFRDWFRMDVSRIRGMRLSNFWEGKEPCWVILNCSKYVRIKCPAYLNMETPCWEVAYTQCEALLGIKKECKSCKVFKLYNKLQGRTSVTELDS